MFKPNVLVSNGDAYLSHHLIASGGLVSTVTVRPVRLVKPLTHPNSTDRQTLCTLADLSFVHVIKLLSNSIHPFFTKNYFVHIS